MRALKIDLCTPSCSNTNRERRGSTQIRMELLFSSQFYRGSAQSRNPTVVGCERYESHGIDRRLTSINCTDYTGSTLTTVPLHAMQAPGGRRGTAPTHFRPRNSMGVSGQRHAPAALYPRGKDLRYPLYRGWVGPRAGPDTAARGKIICEISSSHGGEYDVQSCLLGCTAV
jgi:hypothetical protein